MEVSLSAMLRKARQESIVKRCSKLGVVLLIACAPVSQIARSRLRRRRVVSLPSRHSSSSVGLEKSFMFLAMSRDVN